MLRRKYQEKETANIIAFDMDVRMQKSNGGYFMNNEINRRDFMKLSVASIMTASVTLNLGNTAFATTASENPKDVLKNFFESFSPTDHESWVNYFASSVYGYYREFAQNAFNQAKRLGLLDIDKAELLYAEKVNNVYAPKYYTYSILNKGFGNHFFQKNFK